MNNLIEIIKNINPSSLDYNEWISVGMILKSEGYTLEDWDSWSRDDSRYKPGECERKWSTFNGSSNPLTCATLIQMAKDRGYEIKRYSGNGCMDWDDVIEYDGDGPIYGVDKSMSPTEQLIKYLETLFEPNDYVGYVSNEVWQEPNGKWLPKKGMWTRTAQELINSLKKHKDDLGATIGDWKPECGAWIRFNPVDGQGVKNENITRFKYALVESDEMPISDQDAIYRKLELPIATLVHSGGKSLHAIVKVDADDADEYRKRVTFLYDFLEKHGLKVDKQNRNPSRLSRMPGVTRNGVEQTLLATNIGRKNWIEWLDFVEGIDDEFPQPIVLKDMIATPPNLPQELIRGVLRVGHKMLLSGSSKSGKSFVLMELAIAISEGIDWLGFECRKGRVLYINLEIDNSSSVNRFLEIYKALEMKPRHSEDIVIWNLRGHALPLDQLVPKIIRRMKNEKYDAVIIDPIYKVLMGDENNASEMAMFCNQFDKICMQTGSSIIYCHHHSKGAQGGKSVQDRASGSGVFARDPDAMIDLTEIDLDDEFRLKYLDEECGYTAWEVDGITREFKKPQKRKCWFKYPLHVLGGEELKDQYAKGSMNNARKSSPNYSTKEKRAESIEDWYNLLTTLKKSEKDDSQVSIKELSEYSGKSEKTIRRYVAENPKFKIFNCQVWRIENEQKCK